MAITLNGSGGVTGLTALPKSAMASGSVIQTVSQTFAPYTGEGSERGGSTSYTDTGIVLSITPTVNTSKILVMTEGCSFGYKTSDSQVDYYMRLVGTPSGGSLTAFREIVIRHTVANSTTQRHFDSWNMSYLHDHNGTVAVEYKVQHAQGTACTYVWARYKGATVTLMEVAA
tara:strand:+ start:29 stop:544 length:516 start_codon:yes stop_codon:yes gene_type:complete